MPLKSTQGQLGGVITKFRQVNQLIVPVQDANEDPGPLEEVPLVFLAKTHSDSSTGSCN